MSADLTIEATVITQSGTDLTPVGVTIKGTGAIPHSALRDIAVEALESFTGSKEYTNGFTVDRYPSFQEQTDDTVTMFPILPFDKRR